MNYLQFNDKGKFEPEEQALANYFDSIKQSYKGFYKKHFLRDRFQITKNDFISGDIDVMFHAMKRLGIDYSYNDYPECLRPYLHRKIWESTLGEVRKRLFDDLGNEVELGLNWFIKPKDKLKRFTGFVCETIDDLSKCAGAGNQTKIWCSEPVAFLNEFRCYFLKSSVEENFPFPKGDPEPFKLECKIGSFRGETPNSNILEALRLIGSEIQWSPIFGEDFPKAFALDIGELSNGHVALIEINDAFSLGLYKGCPEDFYAKCLIARWEDLKRARTYSLVFEEEIDIKKE